MRGDGVEAMRAGALEADQANAVAYALLYVGDRLQELRDTPIEATKELDAMRSQFLLEGQAREREADRRRELERELKRCPLCGRRHPSAKAMREHLRVDHDARDLSPDDDLAGAARREALAGSNV